MYKNIINYISDNYFRSNQSKILISFAIISIILNQYTQHQNLIFIIGQIIFYFYLAYDVNCFVYGGCNFKAWFLILTPLIISILVILINLPFSKKFKKNLEKIKSLLV